MKLKRLLNILNPQLQVGALEITDIELKFCEFKFYNPVFYSVKLENGIVKDGIVIDREKFISNLLNLHKQIIGSGKKKINAIINIADNNVYSQFFNLPAISDKDLKEAVNLNLQMISPINFEDAYSDWQAISGEASGKSQLEILGSFSRKEIINTYEECLRSAGFIVVAIEFSGLALARVAAELSADQNSKTLFILLYIGPNGLSFNLVKIGNLYFNHFVSWQSIYADERRISFESFKKLIIDEIKRVSSFYSTHWGGQINDFYLISYGLQDEILKIVSENFSFSVQILTAGKYKNVSSGFFSVFGSALRGAMPRSEDNIISVASVGTEKEFYQQKIIWFLKVWRNIIASILIGILITFLMADIFLMNIKNSLEGKLSDSKINKIAEISEVLKFQSNIDKINEKISLVSAAYKERLIWSSFLEKINDSTGDNVSITRIFIQSLTEPILINALASSEEAALDFKKKLANNSNIENVEMPINKIISTSKGVEFSITFKAKNLK